MGRFGLLGRSLGHSYSPMIHAVLGEYSYELFEVEPSGLAQFLGKGDFAGLNVTIPYKEAVMPYCAELSPEAEQIGSVNTLIRRLDGSLYGSNTDALGFERMLRESGTQVRGRKVLLLGSGGASHAVSYVLKKLGAGAVVLISRSGKNHYWNLSMHADAEIIVNTTPVGMYPHTGVKPLDLVLFPKLEAVLDIIYNPARTALMMEAETLGIPSYGGLSMLVDQAKAAAELFLGREVEEEKRNRALQMVRSERENIILIGMPGSGKTTVGTELAERMGRPFVDSDQQIEASAGCAIPEIFRREGEEGFRKRESVVLEELGKKSGLVISTGGGCVTREENYPLLHQNGTIVFLEREQKALPKEGRPLSQERDLSLMYKERLPQYRRFADLTVPNDTVPEEVAQRIQEEAYEAVGY